MAENNKTVQFPSDGGATTVSVAPNEKITVHDASGQPINPDSVKVDILGQDIIMTNADTGSQIVFLSMALMLFDEEVAPSLFLDDNPLDESQMLGRIGAVGNLSVEDYIAISTILPSDESKKSQNSEGQSEDIDGEGKTTEESDGANTTDAVSVIIASNDFTSQTDNPAVQVKKSNLIQEKKSNAPADAVDQEGDTFADLTSDSSSSATSFEDNPDTEEFDVPPEPIDPKTFELRLLQSARLDSVEDTDADTIPDTRIVRGGGGSDASFVNEANNVQYSTEIIDVSDATENITIYAEDPDRYGDIQSDLANLQMARTMEVEPVLGSGFVVDSITVTGFPSGYVLTNATADGSSFVVTNPTLNDQGAFAFELEYPVPNYSTFTLTVTIEAHFDPLVYLAENPGEEIIAPSEPIITVSEDLPFEVKDVNNSEDYNYENSDGDTVYVLANQPNTNRIFSGSGDDTIYGGVGDNIINGGIGDDYIEAYGGDDTLIGGIGDDYIIAGLGTNTIRGEEDIDTLDYGNLNVSVVLDLGTIINNYAQAVIDGGELTANGAINYVSGIENLITGLGDDTLTGDASVNIIDSGAGDDTIHASGAQDFLDGGDDIDTMDYSLLSGVTNITVDMGAAPDGDGYITVTVVGGANDKIRNFENLTGTSGNDTISGNAQDNVLDGSDGDDTLFGAGGDDTLIGGAGADTVDYSSIAGPVTVDLDDGSGFGSATGSGNDTLDSIENIVGTNDAGGDSLTGSAADNMIWAGAGDDTLNGEGGDDTLNGEDGDDTINGGAGFDIIDGGDGNDTIDAGADDDLIYGSYGDDTIDGGTDTNGDTADYSFIAGTNIAINATVNNGNGSVSFTDADTPSNNFTDTLTNLENLVGTFGDDTFVSTGTEDNLFDGLDGDDDFSAGAGDDTVLGGLGDDILRGEAGDDTLDGGDGNDTLIGGDGVDTIIGGSGIDTAVFTGGGSVSVNLATSSVLNDGFNNSDTISGIENVTGSANNDSLVGDLFANELRGGDGVDTLQGGDGNDTLYGENNDDVIYGGRGNDYIDGGANDSFGDTVSYDDVSTSTGVTVDLSNTTASNDGYNGTDTLIGIENVVGSVNDDTITGDGAVNRIDGGDGDDTINAGAGNDILDGEAGDDTINGEAGADTIDGGAGNDTIDGGDGNDDIDAGTGDDTVYGGNNDDTINGEAGDDFLYGEGGNDTIDGGSGDDTIDGGAGNDTLTGDIGNDLFIASTGDDTINGGDDTDTLDYSGSAAGTYVDIQLAASSSSSSVLRLAADDSAVYTDSIRRIENVIGTDGNDIIAGDFLANDLSGGDGDDTIYGGGGSDTLDGGSGTDLLSFSDLGTTGITIDLASPTTTATYAFDSSTDIFTGFEEYELTNQADTAISSAGIDTISALLGDDTIIGSYSSDILNGGGGNDVVDYTLVPGTNVSLNVTLNNDTTGTAAFTDSDNAGNNFTDNLTAIESITGTSGDDTMTGNSQDNVFRGQAGSDTLTGNDGDDSLYGGDGNDTLDGGDGDDLLDGGDGDDTLTAGDGNDTVNGGDGDDTIDAGNGDDTIDGGTGDDIILSTRGSDAISGGSGTDEVDFSGVDQGITVNLSTQAVDDDGFGNGETISGIENITGSAYSDQITTNNQNNVIIAGDGDDTVVGSRGTDNLQGGIGYDMLAFTDFTGSTGVRLDLENSQATYLNNGVDITSTDQANFSGFEEYQGSNQIDVIEGSTGADIVNALNGADTFMASAGIDRLDGGDGVDTINYSSLNGSVDHIELNLGGLPDGQGYITVDVVSSSDDDLIKNIENVIGTDGDDIITGDGNNNRLEGADGNDTIRGGAGIDVLLGDAGNDTLYGDAGNDQIDGGTGDDTIYGGTGDDLLDGGSSGTDTLRFDDLLGGGVIIDLAGTATYLADNSTDTFSNFDIYYLTASGDTLTDTTGDDVFYTLGGNDVINYSGGDDTIDAGTDDQTATNDGTGDTLDFSSITNSYITYTLADSGSTTAQVLASSNDALINTLTITGIENVTATSGNDTITGNDISNTIITLAGDDVVDGGAGDDTITTGSGNDTVDGGDGEDTINTGSGDDTIIASAGTDIIDGGTGTEDLLDYSSRTDINSSVSLTLNGTTEIVVTIDGVSSDRIRGIEHVTGSTVNDTLVGDASDNILRGMAGSDTLSGRGGNDTLDGGAGNDTADYTTALNAIGINLTLGSNQAYDDGSGGVDTLISIENILGSTMDDIFVGSDVANSLSGGDGDDIFYATLGNDTYDGGNGGETNGDTVDYSGANNSDGDSNTDYAAASTIASINTTMNNLGTSTITVTYGDASTDTHTISTIENITGSTGNDTIIGNVADNILRGHDGDDTIAGRGGDDTLYGGDENTDTSSNDTVSYAGAAGGVTLDLGANGTGNGQTTSGGDGDGGTDIVIGFENVIGSNSADNITGDANDNLIEAGVGDDTLYGAGGNDTLDGESGTDTVDYSAANSGVTANLGSVADGNGTATNTADSINDTLLSIENITGSAFADTLTGDGQINTISGGDGDDVIYGGAGADVLDGGLGTDTADYSLAATNVDASLIDSEANNDGDGGSRDSLTNFENLTGSLNDDVLTGDNANNIIQGLDGDDIIRGRAGNDSLYGGSSDGTDNSTGDVLNYDYITGLGGVDVDLANNTADDGEGGTDTIDGFEVVVGSNNNDRFAGRDGTVDSFDGGTGSDTIDFSATTSAVTINLNSGFAVDGGGSTDSLTSIENAIGSSADDTIHGSIVGNILEGGDGDDNVYAGTDGTNSYYGGTSDSTDNSTNDVLHFSNLGVGININFNTNTIVVGGDTSTFEGFESYNLTSVNDSITTEDGADDVIYALAGNDTFFASTGDDTLNGGSDLADIVDYYAVQTNNVALQSHNVHIDVDLDANTVEYYNSDTVSVVFTDTVDGVEFIRGTVGDDIFRGDAAANTFTGYEGDDYFYGSAAQDTYLGGDGVDTVDYSTQTGITGINITLDGSSTIAGTVSGDGFDQLAAIENIVGTSGGDFIFGDAEINTFRGLAGDDRFKGGAGDDIIYGGTGSDIIVYDDQANADYVIFRATGDSDEVTGAATEVYNSSDVLVETDTTYGVEDAILTAGNDIAYGDTSRNEIFGEAGDDYFYSSGGIDTLWGGTGSDTIDYSADATVTAVNVDLDSGSATVTVSSGGNSDDTLDSFENVIATEGNDTIRSNGRTNNIQGLGGNDYIYVGGGTGNIYDGGNDTDTLSFSFTGNTVVDMSATDGSGYFS